MDILPQLLANSLITGSIYALASTGLALTYGLLRILNFAHGQLLMVGAYLFYLFRIELELSLLTSASLSVICGSLVALLTLRVFVLPFTRYSLFLVFVTTLALATLLESLVSIFFGVNVKSLNAGHFYESIQIGEVFITPIQIGIILSAIVFLTLIAILIHSTAIGRRIRAISESPSSAEALGISQRQLSYSVFTGAVLLTIFAGVMIGYESNLQPTMGNAYTIKAFAAMILGGLGNIWGTVAGSYILGLIENLSIGLDLGPWSLPAGYKDAFAFLIILLVLMFRPNGLFNKKGRSF